MHWKEGWKVWQQYISTTSYQMVLSGQHTRGWLQITLAYHGIYTQVTWWCRDIPVTSCSRPAGEVAPGGNHQQTLEQIVTPALLHVSIAVRLAVLLHPSLYQGVLEKSASSISLILIDLHIQWGAGAPHVYRPTYLSDAVWSILFLLCTRSDQLEEEAYEK